MAVARTIRELLAVATRNNYDVVFPKVLFFESVPTKVLGLGVLPEVRYYSPTFIVLVVVKSEGKERLYAACSSLATTTLCRAPGIVTMLNNTSWLAGSTWIPFADFVRVPTWPTIASGKNVALWRKPVCEILKQMLATRGDDNKFPGWTSLPWAPITPEVVDIAELAAQAQTHVFDQPTDTYNPCASNNVRQTLLLVTLFRTAPADRVNVARKYLRWELDKYPCLRGNPLVQLLERGLVCQPVGTVPAKVSNFLKTPIGVYFSLPFEVAYRCLPKLWDGVLVAGRVYTARLAPFVRAMEQTSDYLVSGMADVHLWLDNFEANAEPLVRLSAWMPDPRPIFPLALQDAPLPDLFDARLQGHLPLCVTTLLQQAVVNGYPRVRRYEGRKLLASLAVLVQAPEDFLGRLRYFKPNQLKDITACMKWMTTKGVEASAYSCQDFMDVVGVKCFCGRPRQQLCDDHKVLWGLVTN